MIQIFSTSSALFVIIYQNSSFGRTEHMEKCLVLPKCHPLSPQDIGTHAGFTACSPLPCLFSWLIPSHPYHLSLSVTSLSFIPSL